MPPHNRPAAPLLLRQRVGSAGRATCHALQAALTKLMRIDLGTIGQPGVPAPLWVTMDHVLRASPQLVSAVATSVALSGRKLPEPVHSLLICMGYQLNRERTDRLLDAFMRPECYPRAEPGVVLLHAIERTRERPSQPHAPVGVGD
jgi:hypothetical protein